MGLQWPNSISSANGSLEYLDIFEHEYRPRKKQPATARDVDLRKYEVGGMALVVLPNEGRIQWTASNTFPH